MRKLGSAIFVAFVACIAVVSPPENSASADPPKPAPTPAPSPPPPPPPAPAPSPAPSPAPGGDCATCAQCVGACTTTYADCQRRCFGQPDIKSQQACAAACQSPIDCAKACPCAGCSIPLPH
jgi:hypothetical protein